MKVPCLREYGLVRKLIKEDKNGSINIEDRRTVSINDGICDSCDLCRDSHCEYYDDTVEGTRRYMKASGRRYTLEGIKEDAQAEKDFYKKHGIDGVE